MKDEIYVCFCFLLEELHFIKSAKKCWPYLKSYWEKSLYKIVIKRGEVCTVVKYLPVTWKIIYLHRICYSLHALECGRSSSKILHLQFMCSAWAPFSKTSALLKPLYCLQARISLLVQQWSGHYLSLLQMCLLWNALFSMPLSVHNLQEQKGHGFYGYQQLLLLVRETW